MTKKTNSPARKQSGKGPMSVDKSQAPAWVRIVIIVVALSFVASGIGLGALVLGNGGKAASTTNSSTDDFQARVKSAQDVLATDPQDPKAIAGVGHAYFEWAVSLYEGGQQSASIPVWDKAVGYYDQVLAITPDDDIVLGNKAFALYYAGVSGSQTDLGLAPAALQAFVAAASDNTALAEQVTSAKQMLGDLTSGAASSNTTPTP